MSLFVEKCNFGKSPQIDNIIKLFALEKWLEDKKYKNIKFVSNNHELANSISFLSKKLLINFEWQEEKTKISNKSILKSAFRLLPNTIQSPVWLFTYLYNNWPLKGVGVDAWRKTPASSTFVSYLINLEPNALKDKRYQSKFWTNLPNFLEEKNHSSNWLHIYVADELIPSSKEASNLIKQFNESKEDHQVHTTLASFLSIKVILDTLQDCLKVFKLNKLVRTQIKASSGYLWPLFEKDCKETMTGIPAIRNLLYLNLFEKAMNELPTQERGCYLQENMGWEFGFISAWQAAGHKRNLIGFPHAAVIFWDLRNFFDHRTYQRETVCPLPLPDLVAVNGEFSKNIYLEGGYPYQSLVELESLRYQYLADYSKNQSKRYKDLERKKVVLVALDYFKENSYRQLNLLIDSITYINEPVDFIIKPHPACPIDLSRFKDFKGEFSNKPIDELMKRSDIVYSSSLTSAAIDAYSVGLPIITLLDGKTLNASPLRGNKEVFFVTSSKSLAEAIKSVKLKSTYKRKEFFYINSGLSRWNNWLTKTPIKN